jgi:hypothetical protein
VTSSRAQGDGDVLTAVAIERRYWMSLTRDSSTAATAASGITSSPGGGRGRAIVVVTHLLVESVPVDHVVEMAVEQ